MRNVDYFYRRKLLMINYVIMNGMQGNHNFSFLISHS